MVLKKIYDCGVVSVTKSSLSFFNAFFDCFFLSRAMSIHWECAKAVPTTSQSTFQTLSVIVAICDL